MILSFLVLVACVELWSKSDYEHWRLGHNDNRHCINAAQKHGDLMWGHKYTEILQRQGINHQRDPSEKWRLYMAKAAFERPLPPRFRNAFHRTIFCTPTQYSPHCVLGLPIVRKLMTLLWQLWSTAWQDRAPDVTLVFCYLDLLRCEYYAKDLRKCEFAESATPWSSDWLQNILNASGPDPLASEWR